MLAANSVYNADYVNKTSVCINYVRSHLITADASDCGTPCTPPLIVVVGHYAQSAAVGGAGS